MRPHPLLSVFALVAAAIATTTSVHAQDTPQFRMSIEVPLLLAQESAKPVITREGSETARQLETFSWSFNADRDVDWSIVSGPAWLILAQDGRSASVMGTPQDTVPFTVVIEARRSTGETSLVTVGPIAPAAAALPVVTSLLGGPLKQHEGFIWTFSSDRDVDWSIVSGPAWLALSETATTATVSGAPTATEPVTLVLRASRAAGIHADTTVGPLAVEQYVAPPVAQARSIAVVARTDITPVQLTVTGGQGANSWSTVNWVAAPPVDTIAVSSTGLVSGTFQEAGTYILNVLVTDSATPARSSTAQVTFTVTDTSPITVTVPSRYQGRVGQQATFSVAPTVTGTLSGRTFTNASGGNTVPGYPGLTIAPATGVISGASSAANTSSMTVPMKVTDGLGRSKLFDANVWVAGATPVLHTPTTVTLYQGKNANLNFAFSNIIGRNGVMGGSNCLATGSRPPGVSYNTDCTLYGTPSSVGTWVTTLSIVDSDGKASAAATTTIQVLANSTTPTAALHRPSSAYPAASAIWSTAPNTNNASVQMLYDNDASTGFTIPAGAGAHPVIFYLATGTLSTSAMVDTDKPFYYRVFNGAEVWAEGTGQAGTTTISFGGTRSAAAPFIEFTSLDGSAMFVSRIRIGYQGTYAP